MPWRGVILLAKWRSQMIPNRLLRRRRALLRGGPFRGLRFLEAPAGGCRVAREPLENPSTAALGARRSRYAPGGDPRRSAVFQSFTALLGCYEQPIHPFLTHIQDGDCDDSLHLGCAEGCYAVGRALRLANLQVRTFNTCAAATRAFPA
jgi:hypothetical protein